MDEKRKIRMVAFDLDGTTLTSGGVLSEGNRLAMEKANAAGVYVVPATGRVKEFLPRSLTELPVIRYVITSNGASVWDLHENRCIGTKLIPVQTALEAQKIFDEFDLYIEYYVNGRAVALTGSPERARNNPDFPAAKHRFLVKDYIYVDDLSEYLMCEQVEVEKLNLMYIPDVIRDAFVEKISKVEGLALTYSNVDNMEINAADCHKGAGLHMLCDALQLDPAEVMAIGDNGNDLGMLREAGLAVAVDNAIDEVKAVCGTVVADYREDGFAEAVERFAL